MKTENYINNALRTKSDIFSIKEFDNQDYFVPTVDVIHGIMGLVGEWFEFETHTDDVNLFEELGDMMWYIAIITNSLELDLDFHDEDSFMDNTEMKFCIEKMQDMMKKAIFYDKEYPLSDLENYLWGVICHIRTICREKNKDFGEVLTANINKLKERFPDKFETDKANNRDLVNERSTLENELT